MAQPPQKDRDKLDPIPFDDALRRLVNTPPKPKRTKPPEKGKGKPPPKGKAAK